MCIKSVVRRSGAFLSALVLCFVLAAPALADETLLEGTAKLSRANLSMSGSTWALESDSISISSGASRNSSAATDLNNRSAVGWKSLAFSDSLFPAGTTCGIYFSAYYRSSSSVTFSQVKAPVKSDFILQVKTTSSGGYSTLPVESVTLFAPSDDAISLSDGVTVVAHFSNSVSDPYSSVILFNGAADSNAPAWYMIPQSGKYFGSSADKYCVAYLYVTSFRVVSTSSSAELDSLESMASAIAAQSEVLSQFYGDIVAVCNQIYQRLGDLQAAQEEANALFSSVISTLNTTNSKLSSINTAMSTYFELVLKSLANESLSIQDCIDDAEARLELYLKPMINYFTELEEQTGESAATLPQHKTDLEGFSSTDTGIDADAQTGLAAILPVLGAFSFIFQIIGIFIGLGILNIIIRKGLS